MYFEVIYRHHNQEQKQIIGGVNNKTEALNKFWSQMPPCENKALTYYVLDIKELCAGQV